MTLIQTVAVQLVLTAFAFSGVHAWTQTAPTAQTEESRVDESASAAQTSTSPTQNSPGIPGYKVERKSITSSVLGEERPYLVGLPDSYGASSDRRYTVIYVLDGGALGSHMAKTAGEMSREGQMPEVIFVAIPNLSAATRERDYTPPFMRQQHDQADSPAGGADRFLAFLREELIPRIERDYRTGPTRMLAGNSRGGLLVFYSIIAEPALFDARFAFSTPIWREEDLLLKRFDAFLAGQPPLKGHFFLAAGANENEGIKGGYQRTLDVLKLRAPASLVWRGEMTPNATHSDNAQRATPSGFRFVFSDPRNKP